MLAFLAARATAGVEVVEGNRYRRSISCNGSPRHFEVSLDQEHHSLSVHVRVADPGFLYRIIERIRTMFDLNADWAVIAESLRAYPELGARMRAAPGIRVLAAGVDSN